MSGTSNARDVAVYNICQANGISDEQFLHHNADIKELEMFMFNMTCLHGLNQFTNLRSLSIVQQHISSMDYLSSITTLESLTFSETLVSKIEALQYNTCLRHLNLSGNKISRIENVSKLILLERVYLHENQIKCIEGLERLTNMKVLNIASNKIRRIGKSLDTLSSLENLNVSANLLCHHDDSESLSCLTNLTSLSLNDPNHGGNPICNSNYYFPYMVNFTPQLLYLDGKEITEEIKINSQVLVLKRKMYCNMKNKVISRMIDLNTSSARFHALSKADQLLSIIRQTSPYLKEFEFHHQNRDVSVHESAKVRNMRR